ncbi:MAG TPA: DMT family transporter [Dongiaceae bacterium]|nr:DMT family transporter [Dongiaceae bacterium]
MTRLQANFLLLLAALFWGGGNVAQKTVLEDLGPLTTVGLRCLIGALVLLPLMLRDGPASSNFAKSSRRQLALSVVLFALAIGSQQVAYAGTSVTNASFLITTTIVMTPFTAWLLFRERPAAILWPASALTLFGVFLLGGGALSSISWGDLACFISAAFYSAWIVVLGRLVARTKRPGLITLVQFILAGTLCFAAGVATEPVTLAALEGAAPELLVLGIFSTGLAYVFQAVAQQHTPASVAAIIMSAESVFGALGGAWLLGEQLGLAAGIGASLIMAAVLMVQVDPVPPTKHLVTAIIHSLRARQRGAQLSQHSRALPMGRGHRF